MANTGDGISEKMLRFFKEYSDAGAPSLAKFARSAGLTVAEIEEQRENAEFEAAYRECNEIRRDYLIDGALMKKFDSSTVKFLLSEEYRETERDDGELELILRVLGDGDEA